MATELKDGIQVTGLAVCRNCHRAYSVTHRAFWMMAGRGNSLEVLQLIHRCCADPDPIWVNDAMIIDVSEKVERYLQEVP